MHADELHPLPAEARPRERLSMYGAQFLADDELVALVLGGGRALTRARDLLTANGGLRELSLAMPEEISACVGVGRAGASALVAAFELGRRCEGRKLGWAESVCHPKQVADFVRAQLGARQQEHFLVLGLDARQRVRQMRTAGIGSLAQVDVHPREVFRPLVRAGMHSAVLVHNHPSGDCEPSESDLRLTARMVEVGRLVGIPVLDHVIVCDHDWTSLAARGCMETLVPPPAKL